MNVKINKFYERPYDTPLPRLFSQWCDDLGLKCIGNYPENANDLLTFDEFTFYQNVKFYKISETSLYGFWRVYGDFLGECRTVKEWLNDLKMILVKPTEKELSELTLFLGYDEFRNWSSGIVADM